MRELLVLNGPNLNLLGSREPEIYGSATLDDIVAEITDEAQNHGLGVRSFQSNVEGELINALHDASSWASGVLFNAGGYTHTSVAIRDAISGIEIPVIELHLSNVHQRERFRHRSLLSAVCLGVVGGFGPDSYLVALHAMARHLQKD